MMKTLLIIHLLTVMVFTGKVLYQRSSFSHGLAAGLISLMFPVGGILLVSAVYRPVRAILPARDPLDTRHSAPVSYVRKLEMEDEINVVPLEESLLVSDRRQRREALLRILGKNGLDHAQALRGALGNEDPETVHYAAAGILQLHRDLDASLRAAEAGFQAHPDDLPSLLAYSDALEGVLSFGDLEEEAREKYLQDSIRIQQKILESCPVVSPAYYFRLIDRLVEGGRIMEAKSLCDLAMDRLEDNEENEAALLSRYYQLLDRQGFEEMLQRMNRLPGPLSVKTRNLLQFWNSEPVMVTYRGGKGKPLARR